MTATSVRPASAIALAEPDEDVVRLGRQAADGLADVGRRAGRPLGDDARRVARAVVRLGAAVGVRSQRLQPGDELGRVDPALDLAVDDHRGRQAAGAEAAGGQQRELPVGGGLPRLDAEAAPDAGEDVRRRR